MKVLQITTNYPCKENPIFGIFMKEQVESLEKYGVENTVVFSNGLKSNPKIRFSAAFIHLRTALRLRWHLRFHKYDVIHCHSAISGLILKVAGGFNGNKTVWSLQNDPDRNGTADGKNGDGKYIKKLIDKFNKIIVKKPIQYYQENIEYLPNGVNIELFKPLDKFECKKKLGLDLTKRYILFVNSNTFKARTQKRKDRFDETIEILKKHYGHEDIEILVMTKTKREDVPYWMNACELYLLTSDEEGSPNAVKECMACNVPIVATPVGNIPDLFNGVKDCIMTNGFEAQELAESVHQILNTCKSITTRDKIIEKGLDINSVAKRLYNIYKDISK